MTRMKTEKSEKKRKDRHDTWLMGRNGKSTKERSKNKQK